MKGVALVLSLLGLCGVCFGAGYDVGDASGWTLGYDYKQWASSKSFQVGDAIDFRYNTGVYNVKLVTKEDYESCNASNALATFSTGLDTLALQTPGHFYFICGIPVHCQAGMKLHINVSHGSSCPTQNPSSPNTDGPPTVDTPPAQPASNGTPYEIGRRARSMKTPTTPRTPKPPTTPRTPKPPTTPRTPKPPTTPRTPKPPTTPQFRPCYPYGPCRPCYSYGLCQPCYPYGPCRPGSPSPPDAPFQPGRQQPKSAAAPLNCFQLWTALLLSLTAFLLF